MQCSHNSSRHGQCPELAMEGREYCPIHAHLAADHDQKQQYQLLKYRYRERTRQLGGHSKLKSLQDEIALAEMMLENRLNTLTGPADEIAAGGFIKEQLTLIEKLKTANQKLELSSGVLITKSTLLTIAGEIVKILLEELESIPDNLALVDRISTKISDVIESAQNTEQ